MGGALLQSMSHPMLPAREQPHHCLAALHSVDARPTFTGKEAYGRPDWYALRTVMPRNAKCKVADLTRIGQSMLLSKLGTARGMTMTGAWAPMPLPRSLPAVASALPEHSAKYCGCEEQYSVLLSTSSPLRFYPLYFLDIKNKMYFILRQE